MSKTKQDRREFIQQLAITGSVAFLAATPWLGVLANNRNGGKAASDKVRLAIIGTGSRGDELLRNMVDFKARKNFDIIALCDNYEPHLQNSVAICAEHGMSPKTYIDYRMLLDNEKPDGVIIATPLHQHAHIAVDCMKSGIHVFCEKSMARTLHDTKWMYEAHIETGKIMHVGHQRLFNPVYLEGMQRIHNGELGTIGQIRAYWHRNNNWRRALPNNDQSFERQVNWRLYKEYSAGLLTELMSHQIQVANWALQQSPVSVMGTGSIRFWKDGREVNDNVALIFTYPDGTQLIYDSMTSNKKYGLEEQIMGHLGTIEFEINRQYSEEPPVVPGIQQLINDIEHGVFGKLPIGNSSWIPETASKYNGAPIITTDDFSDTGLQMEAFIDFVHQGHAPEKITKEGYEASIWTILGDEAIEKGEILQLNDVYKIQKN
jgi:predicted dehydrogenase